MHQRGRRRECLAAVHERSFLVYSRRDFAKVALAGLPLASALAKINSVVHGVHLGVQTYSFRDFSGPDVIGKVIQAMTEIGLGECELFAPQTEPGVMEVMSKMFSSLRAGQTPAERKAASAKFREELKAAEAKRSSIPLDHFRKIGKRFTDAGITVYGYNGSFGDSEEDNNRTFEIAKALGAKVITWSGTISVARKIAPLVDQHKMIVGCHGHSNVKDPNQFATPESFATLMGLSKYFWINLDIGHFTAANYDAVAYIKEHHSRITNIHLKDRKKNEGPNVPWGEGDTPIKAVLQLIEKEKYPIPAYIEYEYHGSQDSITEVKKCFEYAKACLA
jgi:sugar phosphate isomerase/epimerase